MRSASLSNGGRRSEAMRLGDWKLVVQHPEARPGSFENPELELYHLGNDIGEKMDLVAMHPQRAQRMHRQLQEWYAIVSAGATHQPGGWLLDGRIR